MREAGERIQALAKLINAREGLTRKDDSLPWKIMNQPIPDDGVAKGAVVTKEELDLMLDDYYQARGWTNKGVPTKAKLKELGLEKYDLDYEGGLKIWFHFMIENLSLLTQTNVSAAKSASTHAPLVMKKFLTQLNHASALSEMIKLKISLSPAENARTPPVSLHAQEMHFHSHMKQATSSSIKTNATVAAGVSKHATTVQ